MNTTTTPFTSEMLRKDGKYLLLQSDLPFPNRLFKQTSEFLARFKYKGPVTMAQFKRELLASWTVEDYLYQLNVERKAPLEILRNKNPQWYDKVKQAWLAKQNS